jgi:hypothetical protein
MTRKAEVLTATAGLGVQGPFLAYLSGQPLVGYIVLSSMSALPAVSMAALLWSPGRRDAILKRSLAASLGLVGMLVGWYADAGFRPLVGSGFCFCGCSDSLAGLGLLAHFRWMQALMLAACAISSLIAGTAQEAAPRRTPGVLRTTLAALAMLAGMAIASRAMGAFRFQGAPNALFASYLAMSLGMLAGSAIADRLCLRRKSRSTRDRSILPQWTDIGVFPRSEL